MSSQEDIILKLYRYTAVLSKKAVTAESPCLDQLKNKQGFAVTAFLLSTADIYCNLKQPWLTSITSNACRPSLILTQTCHEIILLFCSVLLIMIRSKNVYVIILLKLYRRSCSTRPPYAYFTILQDRQTGETVNTSVPIWIFTDMFLLVSVDL